MAVPAEGLEEMVVLPTDIQELARVIEENDLGLVILDPLLTLVDKKLDSKQRPGGAAGPRTRRATGAVNAGIIRRADSCEQVHRG